MHGFKVGDRVRLVRHGKDSREALSLGYEGTVCDISDPTHWPGVEWDEHLGDCGHVCGGTAKDGHGWYVLPSCLELITEVEEMSVDFGYERNGDIVRAEGSGEIFVFVSGKYYNLSTKGEMRGRASIRSKIGPIVKIGSLVGTGDIFNGLLKDQK